MGLVEQRQGFDGHRRQHDYEGCKGCKGYKDRKGAGAVGWLELVFLAGLLALPALAGCAATTTVNSAERPVLRLPANLQAKLAPYHIYVSDVVTGDVAELGVFTRHVAVAVHGVGLSPDGKTLYVTDIQDNKLDAFALTGPDSFTSAAGPIHAVTTGLTPVHMVSNSHFIFVSDYGEDTVSVINAATWKLAKKIAVCKYPHGIVLSPDGRFVYTSCFAGQGVAVIDVASQTLVTVIKTPVDSEPLGIAVSPDGRYIYATDDETDRLMVLDAATNTYLRSVQVGLTPQLIARSPDGKILYVANNRSHNVSVLDIGTDPADPQLVASVPVAGDPHGLAVTPDGRYVVVANTYGDSLSVIDTSTNTDIGTIPGEKYPINVVITG